MRKTYAVVAHTSSRKFEDLYRGIKLVVIAVTLSPHYRQVR